LERVGYDGVVSLFSMNNRLPVSIFDNPVLAMWKDVGELENIVKGSSPCQVSLSAS
jgi:hypothetical protein